MSSGRTVGSLETWQPDDKSFNKHILREGRGELMPNDESVCVVHVVSIGRYSSSRIELCYQVTGIAGTITTSQVSVSVNQSKQICKMQCHTLPMNHRC